MTPSADQEILTRLREVKEEIPVLAEVIDLQHDLLTAQMQGATHPAIPQYSAEAARARLRQGIPLLQPQEMALDWEVIASLYRQVCRITAQHRPDLSTQFQQLLSLMDDDPGQVRALLTTYLEHGELAGGDDGPETGNGESKEQRELLTYAFNHALRPFLRVYAAALAPIVEEELWQRSICPVCGGKPDFAFLDETSGARHLVCARCDSQWLYPRIKCPFCNTADPSKLSYYPNENQKYRLYVCQVCHRYLKTVDLRKGGGQRVLPEVERVVTVAMDAIARQEGYQ